MVIDMDDGVRVDANRAVFCDIFAIEEEDPKKTFSTSTTPRGWQHQLSSPLPTHEQTM